MKLNVKQTFHNFSGKIEFRDNQVDENQKHQLNKLEKNVLIRLNDFFYLVCI